MKKLIFTLIFLCSYIVQSQTNPMDDTFNLSPNGILEKLFDQYGNAYKLSDLIIGKDERDSNGQLLRSTNPAPVTCGYFNLYFESNCGMENTSNSAHMARRMVVCQVFTDLSNFINSPLSTNGKRVNIWVRNINNVVTSPNGVLGLATAFYNMPYNTATGFGGIADNEVWKTIHAGQDSYTNVISPLTSNGINAGASGVFYHGMMAFNFNTNNSPAINWNTDLTVTTPAGLYDLYSVILHEVTHALGFASLINENGVSKFGSGFNYYSRYDRFLKNNAGSQFLITNPGACSTMYNYSFALSPTILRPNCALANNINNGNPLNQTICADAIKYVGNTSTIPVYTPVCFEPPSSLSHFEDQLFPSCKSPYGNDSYFTMSNALGTAVTKRYLKSQERSVLCDLGYNVNPTFGSSSTASGTINYGGTACTGISVAGINDGVNLAGEYVFSGNAGSNVIISGILSNDTNATGFECLQDVFSTATFSATSGTSATNVTFSSTVAGLHLLRYVPVNGTQRGNITYIYLYLEDSVNCASPSVCNLVINGDFEQYSTLGLYNDNISQSCNWSKANGASPDLFHADSPSVMTRVPCNWSGFEPDRIAGHKGYANIAYRKSGTTTFYESIKTKLLSSLLPNKTYQLSFDISRGEASSCQSVKFQAYLSNVFTTYPGAGNIPIANPTMLFTAPFSNTTTGWQTVTFNFTTGSTAGENVLYIGALNEPAATSATVAGTGVGGCGYFSYSADCTTASTTHYLDNIVLIALEGASFDLPSSVCLTQTLSDLRIYLAGCPPTGVFSGTGISMSGGVYSFNASIAGVGTHLINYTYTNSTNCPITLYDYITVSNCSSTSCPGVLVFNTTEPATSATYQAASTITTMTNYLVNAGSTITLKAGNSITFTPSSEVKANSSSNFTAKIEDCTQTSAKTEVIDEGVSNLIEMNLYPNPADGHTTILLKNEEFRRITISSLEGRTILKDTFKPTSEYQYDTNSLKSGIYIVSIETNSGEIISKKLIKK